MGFDPTGELVPVVFGVVFLVNLAWTGFEAYECYRWWQSPDRCLSGESVESCLYAGFGAAGLFGAGAAVLRYAPKVLSTVRWPKVKWPWGASAPKIFVRTTRTGEKAVRINRPDGSVLDISAKRVKEFALNSHPKAPPGSLRRIKFSNSQPGSKGYKRDPTPEELEILNEAIN